MIQSIYAAVSNGNNVHCGKRIPKYQAQPIPLMKSNYLGEFRTQLEKAKARRNLGIGDEYTLSWGNITGHIETRFRGQFYNGTGAFKLNTSIQDLCGNGSSSAYQKADFNASYSNSIYGNSTTVQPPTQIVHICIKYK